MEAAELFVDDVFPLRVTGGRSTRKEANPGGPEPPHHVLARREGDPRCHVVWAPQAPPWSPFLAPPSSWIIGVLRCFSSEYDLRKIGVLTTLFPAEFRLW